MRDSRCREVTVNFEGGPLDGNSRREFVAEYWGMLRVEHFSNENVYIYSGDILRQSNIVTLLYRGSENKMSKIEEAANAVAAAMPGGRALDPAAIMSLGEIIYQLIVKCQERSAAKLKEAGAKPNFVQRITVRLTTREYLDRGEWRQMGHDVVDGVFKAVADADVADIEALIQEVQSL